MTPEQKNWIDQASYAELLEKWRFAPIGDSYFTDDTGAYYAMVMHEKRKQERDGGVSASKALGWK